MQFRWLLAIALPLGIHLSAQSAEWILVHTTKSGTNWYATDTVEYQDGTIRTWLKMQNGRNSSPPVAILLKCDTKESRRYQAGEFGSEFYIPWELIPPDSEGEAIFNAMCKPPKANETVPNANPTPKASPPSDSYAGRIRAKVRPNIVFTENIIGNPVTEVEVKLASDGTIVSQRITKSSGIKAWDEAVLRALIRTEVLPRDVDGRVHSPLLMEFRPRGQ